MSAFVVSKEVQFDAGHRVPQHASKCRNPHGHRYRVVAYVAGELQTEGSATGMVLDFGDIKELLETQVHDVFDHGFIVHNEDIEMQAALGVTSPSGENAHGWKVIVVPWTPTAEEMARAVYEMLVRSLPTLRMIEVWETPTSMAAYPSA
jgi:6-pyruvoyltetrahydropterin/6-carboxytetrahydropterin synthase